LASLIDNLIFLSILIGTTRTLGVWLWNLHQPAVLYIVEEMAIVLFIAQQIAMLIVRYYYLQLC
jgi:hypothetical protein